MTNTKLLQTIRRHLELIHKFNIYYTPVINYYGGNHTELICFSTDDKVI